MFALGTLWLSRQHGLISHTYCAIDVISSTIMFLSITHCHSEYSKAKCPRSCRLSVNCSKHNPVGDRVPSRGCMRVSARFLLMDRSWLYLPDRAPLLCVCRSLRGIRYILLLACGSSRSTADAYRRTQMHIAIEEDAWCTSRIRPWL